MNGEERAKNFWKIRNKNMKREERRKTIQKIKSNGFYMSFGLIVAFVIIFAIILMHKNIAEASTTDSSAIVETSSTDSLVLSLNETKADYTSQIQYQNLTFTNVNVRENPDINSNILGEISQNTLVDVLQDEGAWIKILYNENPGYIKSEYLGTITEYKKYNSSIEKVFTNVNVRTSPSEESESITVLNTGTDVRVVKKDENGWSEILYDDQSYYIKSDYIGTEKEYKLYQDNLDKTPYSNYLAEKYGFSKDLQRYTYDLCKEFYPADPEHYYAFLLGVMQQESDLGRVRSNYNSNGTRDLGIMQVNSCNWKDLKKKGLISEYHGLTCDELQYDDYINIRAGMDEMNICVGNHGISENAYYSYNTGKHNKKGTNKNSHKVWAYYNEWCERLYQE